uniref:Putative zn finger n=1 Tax=Lutzomyia longipalpis TaxID=7200 RepID=A0A1B0CV52_LUTLO
MKKELDLFTLKQRIFLVKQFYQEFGDFKCVKDNYENYYGTSNPAFSRNVLCEIIRIFEQTGSVWKDQHFGKNSDTGEWDLSSSSNTPFKCEACNQTFLYFNNLKRHVLQSHELLDVYKCDICLVDFRRKHKLVAHMKSHSDSKSSEIANNYKQCEECGKLCSISSYELHTMTHRADCPQKCHICGKIYKWKCGYILHIMKHKGIVEEKTLPSCDICGLQMGGERTLKLHMEKFHPVGKTKPIIINVPSQENLTKINFKEEEEPDYMDYEDYIDHQDVPHGESVVVFPVNTAKEARKADELDAFKIVKEDKSDDDYWPSEDLFGDANPADESEIYEYYYTPPPVDQLCEICGKVLKGKNTLITHMKTHASNCDYKCPYEGCNRSFKGPGSYSWHIKAHEASKGNNSYKCSLCPKSYIYNYLLKNHIISAHSDQMFSCKFCKRVFTESKELNSHLMDFHDMTKDEIDGTNILEECRKLGRETKVKPRPFKCIVCGKGFQQNNLMKKHMKSHEKSDEALMCPEPGCGKSFPIQKYLSLHLLRHTNVRYKCAHCDKDYKDRSQMKRHIKKEHLKEEPRYKCNVCSFAAWHSDTYRRHMKRHNIDDPFPHTRKWSRCAPSRHND